MSSNYKKTTMILTPGRAKKLLANMTSNRNVAPKIVQKYARDIELGYWRDLPNNAIIVDQSGTLLDGQHRCHAVIKANKSIVVTLARGGDASIFPFLDSGRARSAADSIRCLGSSKNAGAKASLVRFMIRLEKDMAGKNVSNPSNASVMKVISEFKAISDYVDILKVRSIVNTQNYYNGWVAAFCKASMTMGRILIDPIVQDFAEQNFQGKDDPARALWNYISAKKPPTKRGYEFNKDLYFRSVGAIEKSVAGQSLRRLRRSSRDFIWVSGNRFAQFI